nr:C1 family peptidase [Lachnospiraceae bacterium]
MFKFKKSFFAAFMSIVFAASPLYVHADEIQTRSENNSEIENEWICNAVPLDFSPENPETGLSIQASFPESFCYSYDPANENYMLTPAKNQGKSGLCWDFAMMASAESNILKQYNEVVDLSEKQFAFSRFADAQDAKGNLIKKDYRSLTVTQGEKGAWSQDGSNQMQSAVAASAGQGFVSEDGSADTEFQFIKNAYKLMTEEPDVADSYLMKSDYYLTDMKWIALKNGENVESDALKTMLMNYGPTVISFFAGGSSDRNSDSEHNYFCCASDHNDINHLVLLVGWDDSFDHSKFPNAKNDGAWIIKNSWGTDYDYISYDEGSLHSDYASAGVYQVSKNEDSISDKVYENIYQYDKESTHYKKYSYKTS